MSTIGYVLGAGWALMLWLVLFLVAFTFARKGPLDPTWRERFDREAAKWRDLRGRQDPVETRLRAGAYVALLVGVSLGAYWFPAVWEYLFPPHSTPWFHHELGLMTVYEAITSIFIIWIVLLVVALYGWALSLPARSLYQMAEDRRHLRDAGSD